MKGGHGKVYITTKQLWWYLNNTLHRGQNNINLDAHGHLGWHRAESHYMPH